jgi:hypothetical protein
MINLAAANGIPGMAEDLRVYASVYRPPNTDIQVFAKIQNSIDSTYFDDEDWTRLVIVNGNNYSTTGPVEIAYGFPAQPNSNVTIPGYVAIGNATATVSGSNTHFSANLAVNNVIKIYDPLFPNTNYAVVMVNSIANDTTLTVDQIFSTNTAAGIGGSELAGRSGMLIDVTSYPHQAFNNSWNDNVVRYYNDNMHAYDNYNTMQVKVVLLSSNAHQIPYLSTIRGVNLSV